jgi:hypothetical protein
MIYFYIVNLNLKEIINFISQNKIQPKLLKNLITTKLKIKKNLKKEEDSQDFYLKMKIIKSKKIFLNYSAKM